MNEINMTNHLAEIHRINVLALATHYDLVKRTFSEIVGISKSTYDNCFMNNKTAPSKKTMEMIAVAFNINEGALDKVDFEPVADSSLPDKPVAAPKRPAPKKVAPALPVVIEQTQIHLRVGKTTIETEVSKDIAEQILKLAVWGDVL